MKDVVHEAPNVPPSCCVCVLLLPVWLCVATEPRPQAHSEHGHIFHLFLSNHVLFNHGCLRASEQHTAAAFPEVPCHEPATSLPRAC